MELLGLHHTTHITTDAGANNAFYTQVLGLRRTWKTVNFDDPSVYHLAYGDRVMSPATNLTFFEHPGIRPDAAGAGSISSVALRVADEGDLRWWADRLAETSIAVVVDERGERPSLAFRDPDGLALRLLTDDRDGPPFVPWTESPVEPERQLHGLHSVTLTVRDTAATKAVLLGLLGMRELVTDGPRSTFGLAGGGPGRELHLVTATHAPPHRLGAGGTHHVAFWAQSLEDVDRYADLVRRRGLPTSGVIDRTFFHNLYFREPGGALFEIAAAVPGRSPYATDAEIGDKLVLPDHLEPDRHRIERALRPLEPRAVPTPTVGTASPTPGARPIGTATSST
jgi:glyoxalase family protein